MALKRRGLFVGILVVMLMLVASSVALADITTMTPDAISSPTNPSHHSFYPSVWREGWGNDPFPEFKIQIPAPSIPDQPIIVGGLYATSRLATDTLLLANTPLDYSMWPNLYNAPISSPDLWDLKLDIIGETLNPGTYFGIGQAPIGAERPYEGLYFTRFQFFAKNYPNAAQGKVAFGLDMTPPDRVTGLKAFDGFSGQQVTGVLKQGRVHLFWDDKVYDRLSGTGYFEAFLDGNPYPKDTEGDSKTSLKVFDLKEHFPGFALPINTPREMTVEQLPAGKHVLQVRAVDRATNEGALSAPLTIECDPDIPTVEMTWPLDSGQTVGAYSLFSARVTDLGGVSSVKFLIDGVQRASLDASPWATVLNLSGLSQGSLHTIKVVATDKAGRTNFAEKDFRVDSYPPVISGLSHSSSPFFPRLRDNYKDNYKVTFKSSEPATATLTIKNSSGKTIRTISKRVGLSSASISWNGQPSSGEMKEGTYKWYLRLTDTAGNRSSTASGSVAIKFYEVVRTGANSVQIVKR